MRFLINNVLVLLIISLSTIILYSCKHSDSSLQRITDEKIQCNFNEQRANYYYEKYGKNNSKITVKYEQDKEQKLKDAFKGLSNVPEEYLQYVFVKYNIPVVLDEVSMGLTVVASSDTVLYPIEIKQSTIKTFLHEFAHAAEGYWWDKFSNFNTNIDNLSTLILEKYRDKLSPYIRNEIHVLTGEKRDIYYQSREVFADLFESWYCSTEARDIIKDTLPEVYTFAKTYLYDQDRLPSTNVQNKNTITRKRPKLLGGKRRFR